MNFKYKQLTEAALQAELESHLTTEINKNRKNGAPADLFGQSAGVIRTVLK